MEQQRFVDGKMLKCGYTTGACACAAAAAAAELLLTGKAPEIVTITLPREKTLTLEPQQCRMEGARALCAVRKYSGDDPDITNGILIFAEVERTPSGIQIDGGRGIGTVTKPGLDQIVGSPAINSGPRAQIAENTRRVMERAGYNGGLRILLSAPDGEALAAKTFNPRLGIVGGISILGTTGIVEPMSSAALADSLRVEIRVLAHRGMRNMLLVLGNYGRDFAADFLALDCADSIMCSNHIGDALAAAAEQRMERVLLVGHIGKLVKLGIGQSNTHSHFGDGRMETLAACAVRAGADIETVRAVLECVTTDAALQALGRWQSAALDILGQKIGQTLQRLVPQGTAVEWICFTKESATPRILLQSAGAQNFLQYWRVEP